MEPTNGYGRFTMIRAFSNLIMLPEDSKVFCADTESGYQFYSGGFFGYGEKGDFVPYSLMHFIPILVIVLLIVLCFLKKDRLRSWKYEGRFRFICAFVMLIAEMSYFWRLVYVGDETGAGSMLLKLPLQVCQWGLICAFFALLSLNDTLFGINFFISLCLTTPALFIPTVISRTGPGYYRYYQFWLEHGLPIINVFYLMTVHRKKPKYRHVWLAVGLLLLMSIPCLIANRTIPNANYMYLGNFAPGSTNTLDPLSSFPKEQYPRFFLMVGLAVVLFHIAFFVWKGIDQLYQKKHSK